MFHLLYDFSVEVGDTVLNRDPKFMDNATDSIFKSVVDSVSEISINGEYLKTVYMHNITGPLYMFDQITERMGCHSYMFPQTSLSCDAACYWPLRCYRDCIISYNSPYYSSCTRLVSFIENQFYSASKNRILSQNFNGDVLIDFSDFKISNSIFINVYNLQGQLYLTKKINAQSDLISMNVSELRNGIYIFQIIDRNSIIYGQKLLIINTRDMP